MTTSRPPKLHRLAMDATQRDLYGCYIAARSALHALLAQANRAEFLAMLADDGLRRENLRAELAEARRRIPAAREREARAWEAYRGYRGGG